MEYHRTKNPIYVQQLLGHRRLDTTQRYIQIERGLFENSGNDEFTVRIASKQEGIKSLLEAGFEYVCEKDGLMFFRKRK
jgi:hypothetical protein